MESEIASAAALPARVRRLRMDFDWATDYHLDYHLPCCCRDISCYVCMGNARETSDRDGHSTQCSGAEATLHACLG